MPVSFNPVASVDSAKVSGNTLVATVPADMTIPAGATLVFRSAFDNNAAGTVTETAPTVSSITCSTPALIAGFTRRFGRASTSASGAGVNLYVATATAASNIPAGTTFTITLGASVAARTFNVGWIGGVSYANFALAGNTTGTFTVSITPTAATQYVYACGARETSVDNVWSAVTGWTALPLEGTSGGNGATNVATMAAYKLAGATTAQTWNPTATNTGADWVAGMLLLNDVSPTITSLSSATGTTEGGQTITITGTNFTGASRVRFGSINAASYTVVSATSITAVTPVMPLGGSFPVVVTNAGADSNAQAFTAVAPVITKAGTDTLTPGLTDDAGDQIRTGPVIIIPPGNDPVQPSLVETAVRTILAKPKAHTLTDSFSTQDTEKWTGWNPNTYVDVATGELVLVPTGSYDGIRSVETYDMTDSYFSAHISLVPGAATGTSVAVIIKANVDFANYVEMVMENTGQIGTNWTTDNNAVDVHRQGHSMPVDATHMRIRIASSRVVFYEVYQTTLKAWTVLRSDIVPVAWDITSMYTSLIAGYWNPEDTGITPGRITSFNPAPQTSDTVTITTAPTTAAEEKSANDIISPAVVDTAQQPVISGLVLKEAVDVIKPTLVETANKNDGQTTNDLPQNATDLTSASVNWNHTGTVLNRTSETWITTPGIKTSWWLWRPGASENGTVVNIVAGAITGQTPTPHLNDAYLRVYSGPADQSTIGANGEGLTLVGVADDEGALKTYYGFSIANLSPAYSLTVDSTKTYYIQTGAYSGTHTGENYSVGVPLSSYGQAAPTNVDKSANDTLTPAVVEFSSFSTVAVSASDTVTPAIVETSTFSPIPIVSSDILRVNIDYGEPYPGDTYPGDEYPGVGTEVIKTDSQTTEVKSSSDTLTPAIVDTRLSTAATLNTSVDTITPAIVDASVFAPVAVVANDTVTPAILDSSTLNSAGLAQDTFAPTITDASEPIVKSGLFTKTSDDTLTPAIFEGGAAYVGQVYVGQFYAGQTNGANVVKTNSEQTITKSSSDTLTPRTVEGKLIAPSNETLPGDYTLPGANRSVVVKTAGITTEVKSASDTLTPVIVDNTTPIGATGPAQDILAPTITDSSEPIVKSGLFEKSASDTITPIAVDTSVLATPNLLSYPDATFEGSIGHWIASSNTRSSLEHSTAQAAEGVGSAMHTQLVAHAGQNTNVLQGSLNDDLIPVTAGSTYTMLISTRAETTARLVTPEMLTYGSANLGNQVAPFSLGGNTTMNAVGSWTQVFYTATIPEGVTHVRLSIGFYDVTVVGEVHYIDKASLALGSSTIWTAPPLELKSASDTVTPAIVDGAQPLSKTLAPPTDLTANPEGSGIRLNFTKSVDTTVTKYVIRRVLGNTPPSSPSDGTLVAEVAV